MKAIISSAIVTCLVIGAHSAYAAELKDAPFSKQPTADLLSGLEHGKADVKAGCNHTDGCHWWILERGNGFINQTQEFIKGYYYGFCSDPSEASGGGSDAEQADIRCDDGPNGVRWATPGSLDYNNTTWTPLATDAQGRTCDFGPHEDECPNASNSLPLGSKSASGDNVTGFAILPPGQHYGQCDEVGNDNELGCDIVKESDLPTGYHQGLEDAKNGLMPVNDLTNHTGEFQRGYTLGYCNIKPTTEIHRPFHDSVPEFNFNCSQPIYPGSI